MSVSTTVNRECVWGRNILRVWEVCVKDKNPNNFVKRGGGPTKEKKTYMYESEKREKNDTALVNQRLCVCELWSYFVTV